MKRFKNIYDLIISSENLFLAWERFKRGKRGKSDVGAFERRLEPNIFNLHRDLRAQTYRHGPYHGFWIRDPKLRRIHKATVRDRVLHHAVFHFLKNIFEPTFIPNSFSCRPGKGTHKGVRVLTAMLWAVSANNTRPCWALKCDVKKFFDSVDHQILLKLLFQKITDPKARWLLSEIISSYERERESKERPRGIPIGNLTSQLFANVYLNKLDQFVKHDLKVKHCVRYTDDFVLISSNKDKLMQMLPKIREFLRECLHLELHPNKIILRPYHQGEDFLGYVIRPHHVLLRTKTKRRMWRKLAAKPSNKAVLQSYLGVLSHADTYHLSRELLNWYLL